MEPRGDSGPATSSTSSVSFAARTASASATVPYSVSVTSPTSCRGGGRAFPLPAAVAPTAPLSSANAPELMRMYHLYVRTHKTRWRYLLLLLLVLVFYAQCTLRGRYSFPSSTESKRLFDARSGGVIGGSSTSVDAPDAQTVGDGYVVEVQSEGRRCGHAEPSLIARLLSGFGATIGCVRAIDVEWWPASNRTRNSADVDNEKGLGLAMPKTSSLSLARSEPPWTVSPQGGIVAIVSRGMAWLSGHQLPHKAPSYELALSAFFRARRMSTGSLDCTHARALHKDIHGEVSKYEAFKQGFELRVPLLLYYNRMTTFAMMQHVRLMRLRNYQLLNYMSRGHVSRMRAEMQEKKNLSVSLDLHARQLDFELTRMSLVFYLQRLHLRALRHSDSMRLETLHFLRYLSSTIPALRTIWAGQDHCSWHGVSCVVVHVPLNSLIDEDHPTLKALVENIFSLCSGSLCKKRRCVDPSCAAYTHHLTRRLFTSAAPAYWLRWEREDDTASMDELLRENTPSSPHAGTCRNTGNHPCANEGTKRSVWTEQLFAHENPDLLLMNPTLLVDVDVQGVVEELIPLSQPPAATDGKNGARGSPMATAFSHLGDSLSRIATPVYDEDVEQPLAGDFFTMQRSVLEKMAETSPRGLRYGKQRSGSPPVTIPYTFVVVNLANMGLRGYLADFHNTSSINTLPKDDPAATTYGANGHGSSDDPRQSQRTPQKSVPTPRSDAYWGRSTFTRRSETRNLSSVSSSTAAPRRPLVSVSAIGEDLRQVLRRLEKIGQRSHHRDLTAYFSEVASLARFQDEEWDPYDWSETMIAIRKDVTHTSTRRLYTILERNSLSPSFVDPVPNIDHSVKIFGKLNPRLIGLLSLDISSNPLLTHLFPHSWLSIPYLQKVHTAGTSLFMPPLHLRPRLYNRTNNCPLSSPTDISADMKVYAEDATRRKCRTDAAASSRTACDHEKASSLKASSLHDEDFIAAVLLPPLSTIDNLFQTEERKTKNRTHF